MSPKRKHRKSSIPENESPDNSKMVSKMPPDLGLGSKNAGDYPESWKKKSPEEKAFFESRSRGGGRV